jgi:predicted ArsR family transcriptional regulator
VSEVKESMGKEGTQEILRRIADRLADEAPPPVEGQSFEERLTQVTDFLESKGFIYRWEKTDEGYIMSNINCPYRQVSETHPELCAMDDTLLRRLLAVEPKHLSYLREGAQTCTCMLQPLE